MKDKPRWRYRFDTFKRAYIQCFSQLYETLSAEIMEDSA